MRQVYNHVGYTQCRVGQLPDPTLCTNLIVILRYHIHRLRDTRPRLIDAGTQCDRSAQAMSSGVVSQHRRTDCTRYIGSQCSARRCFTAAILIDKLICTLCQADICIAVFYRERYGSECKRTYIFQSEIDPPACTGAAFHALVGHIELWRSRRRRRWSRRREHRQRAGIAGHGGIFSP